ncbi:glycosyltransferase family 2 protein [Kushneria aurantia]|uniref:Glycosyltransferase family 2 protein n=1 Tax=Kushneria aurantia TaxID=504092 RepID=A0ABV6FYW3_9GAMM|nr:glycosyltransferase family 2 protein [Kushneria aurantia]
MIVTLIVPVFNEEESVALFHTTVREQLDNPEQQFEILFIDDGSRDRTAELIAELAQRDSLVGAITFSRNFGKEAALIAGIEHAGGDAVIPMDVDLQDPIEVIPQLIERWQAGFDVVLAKRRDRSHDSHLKRRTALMFYRLNNAISSTPIEENVGDFRLMSRQVVEALRAMPERQLFMKGLLGWVGFETTVVEYDRPLRAAGKSKFNGWKLWNLALEGITSFSTVPLRIWTYLGGSVAGCAFLYTGWMVLDKLINGNPVPGYPSLMSAILFLGGIQLIGIGVLGEYIGRIYMESKQRPRYIIRHKVSAQTNNAGQQADTPPPQTTAGAE